MFYGALLFALAKLVLVHDMEIMAVFRPHDDYWYIQQAQAWVWGRPYSQLAIAHLPVYSMAIASGSFLGFPLRLGAELLFIAGALSLTCALGRFGIPPALRLLAFTLIVFHPHALVLLNYSLAETFAGALSLFLVGQLIRVMDRPNDGLHVFGLAIVTALLWWTRKESEPLLIALFGGIAVVLAAIWWRFERSRATRYAVSLILVPIAATVALGSALALGNGLKYGVWATTDFSAPNYQRAYAALQSIAVERPQRFVPVPREAREKAYSVSPAFAELRHHLDGPVVNWGVVASRSMGIEGDIAAGWFYWAFRAAADGAGFYRDGVRTEAFFGRMAGELEAALRDGRLPKRWMAGGLVDPAIGKWLPHLPTSIVRVAAILFPTRSAAQGDVGNVPSSVVEAYDRVAKRRAASPNESAEKVRAIVLARYPSIWLVIAFGTTIWSAMRLWQGYRWSWLQSATAAVVAWLVVTRIGLFAVIDASLWQADQVRYLFPVVTLFALLPLLLWPPRDRRA